MGAMSTIADTRVPVKIWAPLEGVEGVAVAQLRNIAQLPWVAHHVAVMPDVHFGKGATVGSVVAMRGAVSPAAVGVDIGCGMAAVRTNWRAEQLPDSLADLFDALEATIPTGHRSYDTPVYAEGSDTIRGAAIMLLSRFKRLTPEVQDLAQIAERQIGTLGGGNHFIELCVDTEQRVWLMLHSGSRHIGKMLAEVHMDRAKQLAHNQDLVDPDLAAFLAGTPEMQAYRRDLYWAQEYAKLNREVMLERYMRVLQRFFRSIRFGDVISCHHNYVAEETHFGEELFVTRKGAIRAGAGEFGIIPGSMGAKSYIVRGLGNPESFCSASHGAGRKMSRGEAVRTFTVDSLVLATMGVCCRKELGVLDEHPGAYKPIDQVMAQQADLVEIVAELKQVLCVKGVDEQKARRRRKVAAPQE